jgi:hypothetical protein
MLTLTGTDKLDWVSPLDLQRERHESSREIQARGARLRQYGHWGFAEVLDDEAAMREMLEARIAREVLFHEQEGKIAAGNAAKHEEIMVLIPKRMARLVAAEAKESSRLRPQYAALAQLSEVLYDRLN